MSMPKEQICTAEEFLRLTADSEERQELIDGGIIAQPDASGACRRIICSHTQLYQSKQWELQAVFFSV